MVFFYIKKRNPETLRRRVSGFRFVEFFGNSPKTPIKKIEKTKTQRNKIKIIYDGYQYVEGHRKEKFISWRCANHSCTGRIHTDLKIESALKEKSHYHEKDTYKIMRKKLLDNMKKSAIETD
ncbi:hypothetical protein DMUE_3800 [Dictyocoela muelleri]|nr:hypothetical protein DMUE_3800 [Dictyocoela muelleri]